MNINYLYYKKAIFKLESNIKNNIILTYKRLNVFKIILNNNKKIIFKKINNLNIIRLSRHPLRPCFFDYLDNIFSNFQILYGDRYFGDDKSIIGGLGKINNESVMIIGQHKNNKDKKNFGMSLPEGYRKIHRLINLAEKYNIPIVTFINTQGAYPGLDAEMRNQSEAIAKNLLKMLDIKTKIISVIIGEGCSGGAIGLGICDKMLMLEYSYFSTIIPEAYSSILLDNKNKINKILNFKNITAKNLFKNNLIDKIIFEPLGGSQRNTHKISNILHKHIIYNLKILSNSFYNDLTTIRYKKSIKLSDEII